MEEPLTKQPTALSSVLGEHHHGMQLFGFKATMQLSIFDMLYHVRHAASSSTHRSAHLPRHGRHDRLVGGAPARGAAGAAARARAGGRGAAACRAAAVHCGAVPLDHCANLLQAHHLGLAVLGLEAVLGRRWSWRVCARVVMAGAG